MYHYIIDQTRIPARNFDRLLGEVYGYLTEYQISGEVHRVTRLRNVSELVETAVRGGAKTIVAIGDDQNFVQLIEILAEQSGLVLGYIPLQKSSEIAAVLGLPSLSEACLAIAKRRIEEFDLGAAARNYFFTKLDFAATATLGALSGLGGLFGALAAVSRLRAVPTLPVKICVDNNFTVSGPIMAGSLINARPVLPDKKSGLAAFRDGYLDLLLAEKMSARDLFRFRQEILAGHFENLPNATILRGRNFEIEGPKNLNFAIGGQLLNRNLLDVT